ncbi:multidrug effflux MFS transporter [Acidimangrovimonas sediminis]|uniref:multidrug effflux MFS transporter n=1 Tax=Acidimangrovimonas sediminis TaxID=2056283 RepID=UPI000C7FA76C|nr:multidrug effflux MFS transporter [Acidimangrovimonas sediminis]
MTDCTIPARAPRPDQPLPEFIAMIAMLFATVAFSIDSMLPALPEIAQELTPGDENRAQLILTAFVFGMGAGTFFAGPLSDALGRKRTILGGVALYMLGAALASIAQSLDLMIAARMLQGLGAAAPRVVALALVRDLHTGRQMARIMSFAMMIFTTVPAIAPALSTGIIAAFGWRGIFGAFITFSAIAALWLALRRAETLEPADRRPLRAGKLFSGAREVLSNRVVCTSIAVQTLIFASLFATISSVQQIYDTTFGLRDSFPYWFALTAILSGAGGFVNARLVVRLGMRWMVTTTLACQIVSSATMTLLFASGILPDALAFPVFFLWITGVFLMMGLVMGNLNALALEPMGHIAGMAASVVGSVSTVIAVLIAAPIGLAFNGTPVPLMASITVLVVLAFSLMKTMPKAT